MERGVKRRQRRRSPLPFLLLAVAVVGCAFAVAVAAVVPMEADSPGGQDQRRLAVPPPARNYQMQRGQQRIHEGTPRAQALRKDRQGVRIQP